MDFRNINSLLKNEWFLKSVTEITKLVDKYKNDQLKRISAGADKKRKIKHQKLKDNYKSFKNRKEKIQDVKETGNERDENKNKTVLPGIQEKLSDSSRKSVEGSEGKTDSRIDMATKSETKSVKKLAKCFKNSPVKDSAEVNKFKKEKIRKNKRSEEKLAKIAEKFAETSEKNKAKQTSVKEKDVKKSDKDSENISKSERKKKMKKVNGKKSKDFQVPAESVKSSIKIKMKKLALKEKDRSICDKEPEGMRESKKIKIKEKAKIKEGKRRRPFEKVYESEKIRDKNDVKKHRTISKSTNKQCKMKKRKAKKVKKGSKKESKKVEDERKLSSQRRKPEIKFLEDQGSDSTMITKQFIPISKTENKISDDDIEEIDEKIDPIDEKRNEQERIVMMMKEPLEKIEEVKPKQNDMKRDELSRDARKIMHVFIQKKNKLHDMTMKPKQIQYEMNTMQKTSSDITQGSDSSTSPTKSESSEEREDEMKKKEVINENSSSNMTFSGTSNNDQDKNFRIADEKLKKRTEYEEKSGQMKDSRKTEMNASPTSINIDIAQNDQNESKNRSYINGLAQIRTILEIYGIEKERTEAFNKLLDEDIPMSEKEIAENLTIAICDLPMNAELLRKVLKRMQHSNLLSKKEYEMLQTNLVPEAVNESVTIALLVQVAQRQKLKKLTS